MHPREVDDHFAHGRYELLGRLIERDDASAGRDALSRHVARGSAGARHPDIRGASARRGPIDEAERRARIDALIDVAVGIYAPMPAASLAISCPPDAFAAPQWRGELKSALLRAKQRLAHARIDGVEWYWPAEENPDREAPDAVRLLTPFDPMVRDRHRFEMLWGWAYRFEAYTPAAKRKRGYYAMPLLWRDSIIGWGKLAVKDGALQSDFGYIKADAPV